MKKKYKFETITLVILILCLIIEIGFFSSQAFFADNKDISGSITLGELDFKLEYDFDEDIYVVPNALVNCNLKLKNASEDDISNGLVPFCFRFKLEADADGLYVPISPLINENDFFYDTDYYYCKNVLMEGELQNLCDSFLIDKNVDNAYQNKNFSVNVFVDAVQENGALDWWGEEIYNKLIN